MRLYLASLALVAVVSANSVNSANKPPIREDLHFGDTELVHYINSLNTTWKAGNNARWHHISRDVIKGMMGVRRNLNRSPGTVRLGKTRFLSMEIPESFDSRERWGSVCPTLLEVRDQSACGSCWAFGATEAMSDRVCIASQGREKVHLSADDLLSCCTECGNGCDGGEPLAAWEFWVNTGIVSGSNHTANEGCQPYPFPPCEHHNNRTHFQPCHHELYPTPQCKHECQSKYRTPYAKDKNFGRKAYAVEASVESIQKELMTHGPIEVAFEVYEDFLLYKSGVYQHHAGGSDGGHAVKLIGWGTENGTPYWLVVNSWNSDWGENGLFKILRGQNECGIESQGVAGLPRLNFTPKKHHRNHAAKTLEDDGGWGAALVDDVMLF